MKRLVLRSWIAFFSAGWMLPLAASFAAFYDFVWRVVWPLAAQHDGATAPPFHLFSLADDLFYIAMIWLTAVIIYWVVRATR
jgi:hypothetical protein